MPSIGRCVVVPSLIDAVRRGEHDSRAENGAAARELLDGASVRDRGEQEHLPGRMFDQRFLAADDVR